MLYWELSAFITSYLSLHPPTSSPVLEISIELNLHNFIMGSLGFLYKTTRGWWDLFGVTQRHMKPLYSGVILTERNCSSQTRSRWLKPYGPKPLISVMQLHWTRAMMNVFISSKTVTMCTFGLGAMPMLDVSNLIKLKLLLTNWIVVAMLRGKQYITNYT